MDALMTLSWRAYPAAALLVLGIGLAVGGLRGMAQPLRGPIALPAWIGGFRLAVLGLALSGVGAAWLWQLPWLLAVALGVGGEEILESSAYLAALERQTKERSKCRSMSTTSRL